MLILSVSFQKTLTETRQSEKETTNIQRCSESRAQQMSTAVGQTATIPRTQESSRDPGEQHTVTRKTCVLVKNCHPRVTFDAPKPDTGNSVQQRRRKHGQREILERRDIRQVPNKGRVEVQSQNRDLLIRDVYMSCMLQNFCSIFDHSEEARRCHSYFIRMISRTSSESDSSCNRVSNATISVDGSISSKSS